MELPSKTIRNLVALILALTSAGMVNLPLDLNVTMVIFPQIETMTRKYLMIAPGFEFQGDMARLRSMSSSPKLLRLLYAY